MKGIADIFLLLALSFTGTNGSRNQSYSISYKIYNRIVPIRIEFDQNRKVEYVMNLHSDGDGKSVTFYDFNKYIVIYKELTARECYITRLTDETLEKERAQLEKKKNTIVDSSVEVTLLANNIPLSVVGVQNVAGLRAAKFCKGMSSYLISGARRRSRRKKRQSGPYIQRSYGHYGQQTINYSHYGHETYHLGNLGDKTSQVFRNDAANNAKTDSLGYPIFILLPLSGQFGVKTTHNGGYQLHLPTGQAKASFRGSINGENEVSRPNKDSVKGHSWNASQHIPNSTNLPAMIFIPGMPSLNITSSLGGRLIPVQPLLRKQTDEAKTSSYISTTLDNNNVLGSSEVEDRKVFVSGNNEGQGNFNAQTQYVSNHSILNSVINGSPRGANASISATISGKGSGTSNVVTQTLTGKSYADSNIDFLHDKVSTRTEGGKRRSDARSRAVGDLTSTKTESDISASQNNITLLKVNASTHYRRKIGKARAIVRNEYPYSTSTSDAFGSYVGKRNQRDALILRKEQGIVNDMASANERSSVASLYSTGVIAPLQTPVSSLGTQQTRHRKFEDFYQRPLSINNAKLSKVSLTRATYPTVLVEDFVYPESVFLFPEAKKKTRKPEFKFQNLSTSRTAPNYLHPNKTLISSAMRKKYHTRHSRKRITNQSTNNNNLVNNAIVANRNYFGATQNKLQPSKYPLYQNRTTNQNRLRLHRTSSKEVVDEKRSHRGLRGGNRFDSYHPSNVSGAHQNPFRKEHLRYNVKQSVVSKTPGKWCCSQRHVQIRKKSDLRSVRRGCCGRMIYSKLHDPSNLSSEKNCKQICYYVYRTVERIRICKTNNLNTC